MGGDVDSDCSDSEMVGPPLIPGYKVLMARVSRMMLRRSGSQNNLSTSLWFLLS